MGDEGRIRGEACRREDIGCVGTGGGIEGIGSTKLWKFLKRVTWMHGLGSEDGEEYTYSMSGHIDCGHHHGLCC